jgi:hypothetical protein
MVSIGTDSFASFKPVAPLIRRLKFEGEYSDEMYFHFRVGDIREFVNLKEAHIVCADGFWGWHGASEDLYWHCGPENVWCTDPKEEAQGMMRLTDLDEMFDKILEESVRRSDEEWAAREAAREAVREAAKEDAPEAQQ